MKLRGAFTLFETIVSLALVSLLLVCLAAVFTRFCTALHRVNDRDRAIQAAMDVFEQINGDLASAIEITSPVCPDGSSGTVQLTRLYPYDKTRFPPILALPTDLWDPDPYPVREYDTYVFTADNLLTRTVRLGTDLGTEVHTVAAYNLCYFQCTLIQVQDRASFAKVQVSVVPANGVVTGINQYVRLHLPFTVVPP